MNIFILFILFSFTLEGRTHSPCLYTAPAVDAFVLCPASRADVPLPLFVDSVVFRVGQSQDDLSLHSLSSSDPGLRRTLAVDGQGGRCGQPVVFKAQGSTRKNALVSPRRRENNRIRVLRLCEDEECNNRKIGRIINKCVHLNRSPVGGA